MRSPLAGLILTTTVMASTFACVTRGPGSATGDEGGPREPAGAAQGGTGRTLALLNGKWFDGERFVARTMYVSGSIFGPAAPSHVDSTIDLAGGYVVPPFGEAHNHNVDAADSTAAKAVVAKYFKDGVFYVQNPANVLRARKGLEGFINRPEGIDATFSNAVLAAPGGHPMGLYVRNVGRGAMQPTDTNSTAGFIWTIADRADLERKWDAIIASRPDFIKVMLLYSEEYERRRNDSAFFNWRGLSPALVSDVVRRAHANGLRVMAHVETRADFHNALIAGVDQIGHIPGFRGNEQTKLPSFTPYLLTDSDAALAAKNGTIVVTTVGGIVALSPTGPDSVMRRMADSLFKQNVRMLRKHKVRVVVGSDSFRTTSQPEAIYLQELGVYSNAELLRMWSEATARAIFPKRRIGRLDSGFEASLLVLDGDPLADFANVKRIRLMMKQGKLISLPTT